MQIFKLCSTQRKHFRLVLHFSYHDKISRESCVASSEEEVNVLSQLLKGVLPSVNFNT